jgi:RecB family exonuclease
MLKDDGSITISFTEISTFIQCPYRHYLDYECGFLKDKEQTEFLSFGTAIHEGIESLYETCDIQHSQKVFVEKFNELWEQHRHEEHDTFLDIGLIAISNIFQSGIPQREEFTHKEFEVNHLLKDNISFKGFIDLITYDPIKQKICIIDLKTTKNGWNNYQRKSIKTKAQLYLYLIFLSEMYDADPALFECKFVLIEYNKNVTEEFILDGNPDDIKKTRELLDSIIDALYYRKGNRYLKFKNKNNCRFCPYSDDKKLCNDTDQSGFNVVTEYQLYNIFERTEPKNGQLLVLPWRDVDYTKKQNFADCRDKILNEIHDRNSNKNESSQVEESVFLSENQDGEIVEDPVVQIESKQQESTKKFNIYQERK